MYELTGREKSLIAAALTMAVAQWREASGSTGLPDELRADFGRTADEAEQLSERFEE